MFNDEQACDDLVFMTLLTYSLDIRPVKGF